MLDEPISPERVGEQNATRVVIVDRTGEELAELREGAPRSRSRDAAIERSPDS